MIIYRDLSAVSFIQILACFNEAFADYAIPFQMTESQLRYMHKRRGIDYDLSFGAFDGDKMVGFIFNCIGQWKDIKTAYDTGTGVIPTYQGRGISKDLFRYTLDALASNDVKQYLLEVLCSNKPAYHLYLNQGFEVSRTFNCYSFKKQDILNITLQALSNEYSIVQSDELSPILKSTQWDYSSSWQNSITSLHRVKNHIKLVQILYRKKAIAFGYIEPHTGDIPHIGVIPAYRRQGVGTAILYELAVLSHSSNMKYINIPQDKDKIGDLLSRFEIPLGLQQYEMILSL